MSLDDDDQDAESTMDSIVVDPELERKAKESLRNRASSQAPEGDEVVDIIVQWQPHPLNEAGQLSKLEFQMNRVGLLIANPSSSADHWLV